ncbi:hypothetical protein CROQUDRAFT_85377 [Cronartium quercuum f. sp. fusiforme G11]|uniref:Uncharacterized protein n=1 Tax=Cronartium quercuum f. sp. fusiforme G11 TaxID=708437 RepID=A0A9P6NXU7_9BASI|nr:hypothetical protein CROQUDRAFT_85377 [Cronartium quercuum f. sp. fusiforme G11]
MNHPPLDFEEEQFFRFGLNYEPPTRLVRLQRPPSTCHRPDCPHLYPLSAIRSDVRAPVHAAVRADNHLLNPKARSPVDPR